MLNKGGRSIEPCGTPAIIFPKELNVINTNPLLLIIKVTSPQTIKGRPLAFQQQQQKTLLEWFFNWKICF